MLRIMPMLAVIMIVSAVLPASAQSPQLQSNFNGVDITNRLLPASAPQTNQLTATNIIQQWFSTIGKGFSNLFTSSSPTTGLFSTTGSTPQPLPMSYMPQGPFSVPNPQQMTRAQFAQYFGMHPLTPLPQ